MVLERLQEAGLYLKPSKCEFHKQEAGFLGYVIGPYVVKMDPSKVSAITTWLTPESADDIRVFLGLANFYHRDVSSQEGTQVSLGCRSPGRI